MPHVQMTGWQTHIAVDCCIKVGKIPSGATSESWGCKVKSLLEPPVRAEGTRRRHGVASAIQNNVYTCCMNHELVLSCSLFNKPRYYRTLGTTYHDSICNPSKQALDISTARFQNTPFLAFLLYWHVHRKCRYGYILDHYCPLPEVRWSHVSCDQLAAMFESVYCILFSLCTQCMCNSLCWSVYQYLTLSVTETYKLCLHQV